ncbi:uncharacterized protein LOC110980210 [Acanthaster planci]|uniref:Uncharacterized protein LOC110980210 n=1 Tax=Acanthaster planci TaxID=133434 RepID=A0A8B7YIX5_ACAPL|nr:uncharacterized protein LOC110980210 [Acanthaster planci]
MSSLPTCFSEFIPVLSAHSQKSFSWRMNKVKKVVIFDKDGTLINIHVQWAPWIRKVIASIESKTNLAISAEAFGALSFDDEAGKILPGVLGEGTVEMIRDCLSSILQKVGSIPQCQADQIVDECLEACSSLKSGVIQPLGDVRGMFRRLKRRGYQIAINTSDSRAVTLRTLHMLGVSKLVDAVVCGDDIGMIAKPHPVSAYSICAQLDVWPKNAIMVGDSPCDVQLGTNAKLGCAIGVLTGIASRQALETDGQVVVENVTEAVDMILSNRT